MNAPTKHPTIMLQVCVIRYFHNLTIIKANSYPEYFGFVRQQSPSHHNDNTYTHISWLVDKIQIYD